MWTDLRNSSKFLDLTVAKGPLGETSSKMKKVKETSFEEEDGHIFGLEF